MLLLLMFSWVVGVAAVVVDWLTCTLLVFSVAVTVVPLVRLVFAVAGYNSAAIFFFLVRDRVRIS